MNNEKIYDLLATCDETNFELAYQLSKTVDNFSLNGLLTYDKSSMLKKPRMHYFYEDLSRTYFNKIGKHYVSDNAKKYYKSKLKDLSVGLGRVRYHHYYNLSIIYIVYDFFNNNKVGSITVEHKFINNAIKPFVFHFIVYDIYQRHTIDEIENSDVYIQDLNILKERYKLIKDERMIEKYSNEELTQYIEHYNFSKEIFELKHE